MKVGLHFGPTQSLLRLEPIPAGLWLPIIALSAVVVTATEGHKLAARRTGRDRPRTTAGQGPRQ